MPQTIYITMTASGSSHSGTTTYEASVPTGTVSPNSGITAANLNAGVSFIVSSDSVSEITCSVENGVCTGEETYATWVPVSPSPSASPPNSSPAAPSPSVTPSTSPPNSSPAAPSPSVTPSITPSTSKASTCIGIEVHYGTNTTDGCCNNFGIQYFNANTLASATKHYDGFGCLSLSSGTVYVSEDSSTYYEFFNGAKVGSGTCPVCP